MHRQNQIRPVNPKNVADLCPRIRMFHVLLIFLLCSSSPVALAQDAVIDSIRQSIEKLRPDDTTRIQRYLDLAGVAQGRRNMKAVVDAVQSCVRNAEAQGRPFGRAKALVASGSMQMMQGAVETGLADMKKGITIWREIGEKRQEARALYLLGGRLNRVGRIDDALSALNESESIYTTFGDSTALWDVWNVMGATYHAKSDMKQASTYFARCLGIAEARQQKAQVAMSLTNLANTLPDWEAERSVAYYRRALEIFREMGDKSSQAMALQVLGVTLRNTGRLDESRVALEESLVLSGNEMDYSVRLNILNSLSVTYSELGMKDLAAKTRQEHLTISRKLQDPLQLAMSLVNLANELNETGDFAEAEANALEACKLFDAQGEKKRMVVAYGALVISYEGMKDSVRAYAAFKRRTELDREVQGLEAQKHIDELAMKYDAQHREQQITQLEQEKRIQALTLQNREVELERQRLLAEERQQAIRILNQQNFISELELGRSRSDLALQKVAGEKKNKELALLKTKDELQASVIDRQSTERNALVAGIALLTLIAVLSIKRVQGRRREAALRAEAAEAESLRVAASSAQREQAAQQEYTRQLIQSQEKERQRIAQELHDSLSQSLLVMRNRAMLGLRDGTTPEKMEDQLKVISDMAAQSVDEVRAISRDLRPSQLDRLGLTETIRWSLDTVAPSTEIAFTVDITDIDNLFPPESEIAVFRIVQEAVNNILKHSGAREAVVAVTRLDHTVRIVITDDGRGIDAGKNIARGGMGLRGIEERVRMLGGTLVVSGEPGRGTTVRADFPVTIGVEEHAER